VGLLMNELEILDLRENTIVVLLGDNGYQIGEHNMWGCKHTNFETSAHTPLIISAPHKGEKSTRTKALVEYVDIYPTLAELCDLKPTQALDGESLVPLFENPELEWEDAAFSSYPKGGRMGTSMRTDQYRFTEWKNSSDGSVEYELYDHQTDPEENRNVANDESYQEVKKLLIERFAQGWNKTKH